jgi:hypothetical protein
MRGLFCNGLLHNHFNNRAVVLLGAESHIVSAIWLHIFRRVQHSSRELGPFLATCLGNMTSTEDYR